MIIEVLLCGFRHVPGHGSMFGFVGARHAVPVLAQHETMAQNQKHSGSLIVTL